MNEELKRSLRAELRESLRLREEAHKSVGQWRKELDIWIKAEQMHNERAVSLSGVMENYDVDCSDIFEEARKNGNG